MINLLIQTLRDGLISKKGISGPLQNQALRDIAIKFDMAKVTLRDSHQKRRQWAKTLTQPHHTIADTGPTFKQYQDMIAKTKEHQDSVIDTQNPEKILGLFSHKEGPERVVNGHVIHCVVKENERGMSIEEQQIQGKLTLS